MRVTNAKFPGIESEDEIDRLTALVEKEAPGWNLGNSLEAIGGETNWGNAPATQAMLNAVKAAGFNSVRIPMSWKQYADSDDNIRADWMARVTEVVNYARNAGLYAVINIHWDGGWMQPNYATQAMANARITRLSDDSVITELSLREQPLAALIEQAFLRVLSRPPTADQREMLTKQLESGYAKRVLPAPPKSLKKEYDRTLQLSWSNHLNDKATNIKLAAAKKIANGDEPTPRLRADWRERMEDALWAMVNSPEFLFVP